MADPRRATVPSVHRRLRKQLAVLAVLAAFFSSVVAVVVAIVYEPPSPPPPPPPTYADLVVVSTRLFRSAADQADLLAMIKNPNADAGVRAVPYTFEVRSGSALVAEVTGRTFFLPGQEKPLVAINANVPAEGTEVSIHFGRPEWVPVAPGVRSPSLIVVSRQGNVLDLGTPVYEVKGVLANESGLDYLTVEVTALGFDASGDLVGAGRTFVGSLQALERREFTVSWPLQGGVVVSRTREYPEVNIFSKSAVQPRSGGQ